MLENICDHPSKVDFNASQSRWNTVKNAVDFQIFIVESFFLKFGFRGTTTRGGGTAWYLKQ